MKSIICAFATLSSLAFCPGFARAAELEAVNVVGITTVVNLMPPGPNRPYSIFEVKAISGGCTRAKDFTAEITQTSAAQEVKIVRTKADTCEAVARPVTVTFNVYGLERGKPVIVKNPALVTVEVVH